MLYFRWPLNCLIPQAHRKSWCSTMIDAVSAPTPSPRAPITVAYVISTLDTGGAEVQLLNVVNALPPEVHPVIFVLRDSLALRERLKNPRARIQVVRLRARWDLVGWLKLASWVRELEPAVIHSHMLLSNLAVRALAPFCRVERVINHEHGLSAWKGRLLSMIDRASQPLADAIIVVSEASRAVRLAKKSIDPGRVVVLPNPIDCNAWSRVPAASGGAFSIWGIAARLSPVKRIERAIEMLASARAQGAEHRLLVAGDGPERQRLEALAERLGLMDAVEFLGEIGDMTAFYSRIDVLLLTSESEDCPMTVLEGLACGKFVAATPVGGVPALLTETSDAHLIEDEEATIQVLRKIPAGFDSARNRELARRFDVGAYVSRLMELYGLAHDPVETTPAVVGAC